MFFFLKLHIPKINRLKKKNQFPAPTSRPSVHFSESIISDCLVWASHSIKRIILDEKALIWPMLEDWKFLSWWRWDHLWWEEVENFSVDSMFAHHMNKPGFNPCQCFLVFELGNWFLAFLPFAYHIRHGVQFEGLLCICKCKRTWLFPKLVLEVLRSPM